MIAHKDPLVQAAGIEIANHCAEIERLFKADVKVTVVVRHPDFPDGARDVVITNDTIRGAIVALEIREKSEADGSDEEVKLASGT